MTYGRTSLNTHSATGNTKRTDDTGKKKALSGTISFGETVAPLLEMWWPLCRPPQNPFTIKGPPSPLPRLLRGCPGPAGPGLPPGRPHAGPERGGPASAPHCNWGRSRLRALRGAGWGLGGEHFTAGLLHAAVRVSPAFQRCCSPRPSNRIGHPNPPLRGLLPA